MSLGCIMLDIAGVTLNATEREMLQHPQVAGVILFSRNYASPAQLQELTQQIHALRHPRLLIAVDHEGGRVQRFREGFTRLPAAALIGQHYAQDPRQALAVAEQLGWLLAIELLSSGVDFSFAPVLDLCHGISAVIGDRAWHTDPTVVSRLTQASVRGMARAGMKAVGKHFPGHGGVTADSHTEQAIDKRTLAELQQSDIIPFAQLIANDLPAIMPAHVIYPAVDALPVGYSQRWLQDILREELQFQGAIFSDDLSMQAADIAPGLSYTDRARRALQAGCDCVLICNQPEHAAIVLESLQIKPQPTAQIRLARMHGKTVCGWSELQQQSAWQQAQRLALTLIDHNESEG